MEFRAVLISHAARWPKMTPQDAVKLCYQSVFGPGHMIADPQAALDYLERETAQVRENPPAVPALFEPIGGGLYRAHLSAWPEKLPPDLLGRAFLLTAQRQKKGDLAAALATLEAETAQGNMPFSESALASYLERYRADGCPAVHHSAIFSGAYHPAYRVVSGDFARYFPLIAAIYEKIAENRPFTVAVDGRCASGKSTLAAYLNALFGCSVVHMDDFFLPFERKTPQRLALPGGNADHERFAAEILPRLNRGEAFSYRRYDCETGAMDEKTVEIPASPFVLVEGSYCLYPPMADSAALRVFLTVSEQEQRERLAVRSPMLLDAFLDDWIPMEEAYFRAFEVKEHCDFVFDTTDRGR